jgi:hypothetical protein
MNASGQGLAGTEKNSPHPSFEGLRGGFFFEIMTLMQHWRPMIQHPYRGIAFDDVSPSGSQRSFKFLNFHQPKIRGIREKIIFNLCRAGIAGVF